MRRTCVLVAVGLALAAASLGQEGGFGGGGFGGGDGFGGGGFGGGAGDMGVGGAAQQQQRYEQSVRETENMIQRYLSGSEIKNILTPGEYSEWPLTMKAGQVVIAEARSDAFDPALEIVDKDKKVLATNDDRYPGDQRPLLLWRCEKDGDYSIRGRCFRDKAGGQFFLRMKVYESLDSGQALSANQKPDGPDQILLRVPMKAGQIKVVKARTSDGQVAYFSSTGIVISPTGLPDIGLGRRLESVSDQILAAPVDGDYYLQCYRSSLVNSGNGPLKVLVEDVAIRDLALEGGTGNAEGDTNVPVVWTVKVKKGELLQAATPSLSFWTRLVVTERPAFEGYSLSKPESNPFFPRADRTSTPQNERFTLLPSVARDSRQAVFVAKEDATLWIGTSGRGVQGNRFALTVRPAATTMSSSGEVKAHLAIGKSDYWTFDAKTGDVMTLNLKSESFAVSIVVYEPDMAKAYPSTAGPDQTSVGTTLIATKPGRYVVAASAIGDGGSGDYTLTRTVYGAKEFSKGQAARGQFTDSRSQVWKFTATPEEPLLVRWASTAWDYMITVRDQAGTETRLPIRLMDKTSQYGILKVDKPTEYLIVLTPNGSKASYSIELGSLPGYGRKD